MRTKNTLLSFLVAIALGSLSSCDSFLDTMPDQRTDVDTSDKVRDLLLSAYPTLIRHSCLSLCPITMRIMETDIATLIIWLKNLITGKMP